LSNYLGAEKITGSGVFHYLKSILK